MSDYPEIPDDFGHWLAGFIDGEGSFLIYRSRRGERAGGYRCRFTVSLRDDDAAILHEIVRRTGVGTIVRAGPAPGAPQLQRPRVYWNVDKRGSCFRLVEVLDRYPLRAKKARDYAIWRQAVVLWDQALPSRTRGSIHHNRAVWQQLGALQGMLRSTREYHGSAVPISEIIQIDPVADQLELVLKERVEPGHVLPVPLAED